MLQIRIKLYFDLICFWERAMTHNYAHIETIYCSRIYCLRDNYHCSFLLCSLTTIFRGNEHGTNFYLGVGDVWSWRRDARVVSCRSKMVYSFSWCLLFPYTESSYDEFLLFETSSVTFQDLYGASRRYSFDQVGTNLYTRKKMFLVYS